MTNNIISNDCVGGYIYKDWLKTDNQNPFIWSSIDIENFIKIVEFYNDIDFRKIKCELVLNNSGICKQGSLIPKIIIDDDIEVNYFHYIYDKAFKAPTSRSGYTLYENIISYTIEAYNRRLIRMVERPTFIWDVTRIKWYNKTGKDPLNTLEKIETDSPIIIYQPNIVNSKKGNITLLNKTNGSFEVNVSAKNIYNNALKNI